MLFRPYTPKGQSSPVCYYATDNNDVMIKFVSGRCQVVASSASEKEAVNNYLLEQGLDLSCYTTSSGSKKDVYERMQELMLISTVSRFSKKPSKSEVNKKIDGAVEKGQFSQQSKEPSQNGYLIDNVKLAHDLVSESKGLEIENPPFRSPSLKNLKVVVSSNELTHSGSELLDLFSRGRLMNIQAGHLPVGDIVITDESTGDTLFVERKTIPDMYASVMNGLRSHDQSERLFEAVQSLKKEGKRARAIWMIESTQDRKVLMDDALPEMKNTAGLWAYFDMINDQSVYQSYSVNHTVYLCLKLAQTFFEQKLFYSAKTSNKNVNRSKKDRLAAKTHDVEEIVREGSNVQRHTSDALVDMLSYLPNVNTKVAKNLVATGKTFAQIMQMTLEEISAINGVGKVTASKIHDTFNKGA